MTLRGKSPEERHEDHLRRMAPGTLQGTSRVGSPDQGRRGKGNPVSQPPAGQDHGHSHTELSGVSADQHHGQVHDDTDHSRDYDADFVNATGDSMSGNLDIANAVLLQTTGLVRSIRTNAFGLQALHDGVGYATLGVESDGALRLTVRDSGFAELARIRISDTGDLEFDGTVFFDQWLVAVGAIESRGNLQAYDNVLAGSNGSGTGYVNADQFLQRASGLVNDLGTTECSNIRPHTDRATGSSVGESDIRYLDAYIYNGVTSGSDPADKTDVVSLSGEDASERVSRVAQEAAIGFRWLDGTRRHLGFDAVVVGEIHGDVSGAYVDSAVTNPDAPSAKGLRAHELIPDLYAALNVQIDRADALEQRVAELERVVSDLSRRVG